MPEIRTNNEYKYTQSSRMYILASGFFWKRLNAYWRLEILVMRRIFYFLVHKKLVNVFFLSFNVFVKCKKTLYLSKSLFKTYLKSLRTKSLSFCCLSLYTFLFVSVKINILAVWSEPISSRSLASLVLVFFIFIALTI